MKTHWPVIALVVLLLAVVGISYYSYRSNQGQQNSASNWSPLSTITPSDKGQGTEKANAPERPPDWRRLFAWPGGVECLGILLTLVCVALQASLMRQSITSSESASKAELRAYVGVTINTAGYQDRDKEIRFEGTPTLTNTGKTPAHRVRYRNHAAVLKEPIPANYKFPSGQEEIGEYVLGINLPMVMHIVVDDYVDQNDVPDIMRGDKGRALYCWGVVSYDDAFGEPHTTNFCHRLYFFPHPTEEGHWKVNGNYVAGKNDAT